MKGLSILLALSYLLFTTGCVSHQELVNFREQQLPLETSERINNAIDITVQPQDLLRISVQGVNPEEAQPFNQVASPNGAQQNIETLRLFSGYLVDDEGFIDFPVVGRVSVIGHTLESLQTLIRGKLKTYLHNVVVNVRFLNFKVTVLGEVAAPGVISQTNGRVTLFDALGMAGDLTTYANRRNILIVREQGGVRSYHEVDLQKDDVFNSPYFYLHQNDLIYVSPIKARVATVADPATRVFRYVSPVISVIALILTLANR